MISTPAEAYVLHLCTVIEDAIVPWKLYQVKYYKNQVQCVTHASNIICCLVAADCLAKDLDTKFNKGACVDKMH